MPLCDKCAAEIPEPQLLTEKQKQVFDCILRWLAAHGHAPTYWEMAKELGVNSLATVSKHVGALVQKGYVTRRRGSARSINPNLGIRKLAAQKKAIEAVQ
jgi:repressor LexA